jgi:hypothetical protein
MLTHYQRIITLAKQTPSRFVARSLSVTVVHIAWDNLHFTLSNKGFAELLEFLRGEACENTASCFDTALIRECPRGCLWLGKTGVILPSEELEAFTDMLLEAGKTLTLLPVYQANLPKVVN